MPIRVGADYQSPYPKNFEKFTHRKSKEKQPAKAIKNPPGKLLHTKQEKAFGKILVTYLTDTLPKILRGEELTGLDIAVTNAVLEPNPKNIHKRILRGITGKHLKY